MILLGGWIVLHLLERGEDPSNIRILDIRPPVRLDLTSGIAAKVAFVKVDVTNADDVEAAFSVPWPNAYSKEAPLTVIHTAAVIRFYERWKFMLPFSWKVNVEGVRNSLEASLKANASCFVFTSSASIVMASPSLWPFPWQKHFNQQVQIINDDSPLPKTHAECFSNYSFTKLQADILVRSYDKRKTASGNLLRTGCIRPGNMVYGTGGDPALEQYMRNGLNNPTWLHNVIQTQVYVENVSLAHLCYEQRLLELSASKSQAPDIGGQGFLVTDPNPPIAYNDIYRTLGVLTNGRVGFYTLSAAPLFVFSYVIEGYYITRHLLTTALPLIRNIAQMLM